MINSAFLLILILALTNEDPPQGPAIPVLVLLALSMGACLAAWRWQRAGGIAAVAGGVGLIVAAYLSSRAFGVGSAAVLPALIYGVPFVLSGILFWASGRPAK